MTATITSKGQITIPLAIRERLGLKTGDQLEFDETAPILVARRAVNREQWRASLKSWRKTTAKTLKGHPWEHEPSSVILEETRGETGKSRRGKP